MLAGHKNIHLSVLCGNKIVLETSQERWLIEMDSVRDTRESVLSTRLDDDKKESN